jgi:hypothetical protein
VPAAPDPVPAAPETPARMTEKPLRAKPAKIARKYRVPWADLLQKARFDSAGGASGGLLTGCALSVANHGLEFLPAARPPSHRLLARSDGPQDPSRHATYHRSERDVLGDHSARRHDAPRVNHNARQNPTAAANPHVTFDFYRAKANRVIFDWP